MANEKRPWPWNEKDPHDRAAFWLLMGVPILAVMFGLAWLADMVILWWKT
jgi:hypothetical protein